MIEMTLFPQTVYHPVRGAVTVEDAEAAAKVMTVPTDWFPTAAQADAARTENEAQAVIHKGRRDQVQKHEDAGATVVHHSVTHQASVDGIMDEAAAAAELEGAPPPKRDKTTGAELLT